MATAPELIDAVVNRRVLVYGSPPPDGRDLDLLVRPPEERAIGVRLADAGFVRRGNEWARFASCSVEIVELTSVPSWHLPSEELDVLFKEGREIEGLRHLVLPSAPATLLILARRVAYGDGVLDRKLRTRLERALAEDPAAWLRARERAERWSASAALDALHHTWLTGARIPRSHRSAARRERCRGPAGRQRPTLASLRTLARGVPRPHRGAVVAFSGLDGAGKSSQAVALRETLDRLGYDAIVVRTRIAWDDWLWPVARPIKRLLAHPLRMWAAVSPARGSTEPQAVRERENPPAADQPQDESSTDRDPVTRVREASSLLTDLWTLTITIANASSQWKLMRRQLLRGGVVICDRYTLDSIVELRYSYGSERRLRPARVALSRLYPRPVRAYFLDVLPQTALERKGEWGIGWLSDHRGLYLEELERLAVRLLDGEQDEAGICAEVARDVWFSRI